MLDNIKYQKSILLLIVTLFWFSQYIYIPFQTPYLTGINVSTSLIGTIVGAYGISQLIVRLPLGIAADCVNKHKLFIFLGSLIAGLASLIRLFFPSGYGFLLASLMSGCASATWISFMVFYTNFYPSNKQQFATSKIIMFNNIGILIAFLFGTLFFDNLGMNTICIFSSIAGVCGAILSLFIKESKKQSHNSISLKSLIGVCSNKRLIFFGCLALIQQGIQMSTTMSFTTQILEDLGATSALIGYASITYMICAVIFSRLSSCKFFENLGPKICIPSVFFMLSLYCILVPIVNNIYLIFILQIIPGMATGILFSYITSEAMKNVPLNKKSTSMGFFQAIYALGMTTFPVLTGNIAEYFSIKYSYFTLAIICYLALAASIFYYNFYLIKYKNSSSNNNLAN